MYRPALALALIALVAAPDFARSADRAGRENLLLIEAAMQDAIKEVEPAIACILVSRSKAYQQFGALPSSDNPGRLGSFDPRSFEVPRRRFDPVREDLIRRLDLSNPDHVPESFGSGVVIDASGLVLTNYHVVREATKVFVRLPGGKGSYADIHAADPRSDLAVLKLLTPPPGLKALKPGRGEDARKGQLVLLLANPYAAGFRDGSPCASWGIISNVRRRAAGGQELDERNRTLHHYGLLLQTDARLNLGCSGGALINLKGELIGLTNALAALTGIDAPGGFAVPMTAGIRRIIDKLREGKEVEYGFLGVRFGRDQMSGQGVYIDSVTQNSPAAQAGLVARCSIVKIDGVPIHTTDDVFLAIGTALAGSQIKIEVMPGPGAPVREHVAELAKYYLPSEFIIASNRPPALAGLRVDYTSTLVRSSDLRAIPDGVVIREVLPSSAAERANLQKERIIIKVNGRPVNTPAEYYHEVQNATGPLELTLSNNETVKIPLR